MHREVRRHVRHKMKDGMLAVLPLPGTLKVIVGQIIDISENGLALRHKDEIAMSLGKAELILMGHEHSEGPTFEIPARLVYEQEQERRLSIRFSIWRFIPGTDVGTRLFHSFQHRTNWNVERESGLGLRRPGLLFPEKPA